MRVRILRAVAWLLGLALVLTGAAFLRSCRLARMASDSLERGDAVGAVEYSARAAAAFPWWSVPYGVLARARDAARTAGAPKLEASVPRRTLEALRSLHPVGRLMVRRAMENLHDSAAIQRSRPVPVHTWAAGSLLAVMVLGWLLATRLRTRMDTTALVLALLFLASMAAFAATSTRALAPSSAHQVHGSAHRPGHAP